MAAKEKVATVEVSVDLLQKLQARLDALELADRVRLESANPRTRVIDAEWEALKVKIARTAAERTQEIADARFPDGDPFTVSIDPTTAEGKPGPNINEHFPLQVRGHSTHEAEARYLELMGITKHDYRLRAEPVAA